MPLLDLTPLEELEKHDSDGEIMWRASGLKTTPTIRASLSLSLSTFFFVRVKYQLELLTQARGFLIYLLRLLLYLDFYGILFFDLSVVHMIF